MRRLYTSAHFPGSLATSGRGIALRATGGMATITAMTAGRCNLVAVSAAGITRRWLCGGTGSAGARDACNSDGRRMGRGRFPPTPPLGSIGRIGQAEDRSAGSNSCTDYGAESGQHSVEGTVVPVVSWSDQLLRPLRLKATLDRLRLPGPRPHAEP
jgi:hypothetical protein